MTFVPFTCFFSKGFLILWRGLVLNRRKQRELIFLLLFEQLFTGYSLDELKEVKLQTEELAPKDFTEFVEKYFNGIIEKMPELDALIEKFSLKWGKDRLSRVALVTLRLAVYEMLYCEEIPTSVAINEAVELSKKYGDEKESAFINGILGGVSRRTESADD